jgi:redox-sensitive bicupin YhaK (pirin superfamily)
MSYTEAEEAPCHAHGGSISLLIEPKLADLGEFSVRRALPSRERRMVGPFVFFDHMGPAEFPPGKGIAVRPHPHIGIATITYLFEGEILHRDSLGVVQPIRAGAVNLMTAGRGIVHSERAGDDLDVVSRLHGIQSWIALPTAEEECEPDFRHYPADALPEITLPGATVRVILGEAFGEQSPVKSYSRTLYLDCRLTDDAEVGLPDTEQELALYVAEGEVLVDGERYGAGVMAVACPGQSVTVTAAVNSRVMVIGGDALGARAMFWNFVHSSRERIQQAKADWRDGRFPAVPGDDEFIPLPD